MYVNIYMVFIFGDFGTFYYKVGKHGCFCFPFNSIVDCIGTMQVSDWPLSYNNYVSTARL